MKNFSNYVVKRLSAICFVAICLTSGTANAVITLTFADNTNPIDPFPSVGTWPLLGLTFTTVFSVTPPAVGSLNSEFRMISTGNVVGGGGHKNLYNGGEQWIFGDDINLTAVTGTEMTGGATTAPGSAEPGGGVGIHRNAIFFDIPFGFLAPFVGSPAAAMYGNATITVNIVGTGGTIQVIFPVLEAQWGNTHFPLGLLDDGVRGDKITFDGTLSSVVLINGGLDATFDFVMTAEHVITGPTGSNEDPGSAGFSNWTPQWNLVGSGFAPVVTLNPPTSTDTLAPTLGGTVANDGRVTQTELTTIYSAPVDPDVSSSCVGSCFAFTVTGLAGPTTQVVLPLSTPIPNSAVYRKLIAGAWTTFDETTDTIESGPGVQGDCTGVTFSTGLNAGDFCVRLTIADDGQNDDAPATVGTIIDPGGVGVLNVTGGGGGRDPVSIDDAAGCSISRTATNVTLFDRADWLLLACFVSLLALRRKMLH